MSVLKSLCLAFSMYSKLPAPRVAWEEKNMRYVLCFLPLIGIVQGMAMLLLWMLRERTCVYIPFEVFVLTGCVLPMLVTGGIHMDGFVDTMDALHSWQDRTKKLEILKDPHIGAFAAISLVCYFCLYGAGLFLLLTRRQLVFLMIGFFLSRTLSAFALITVKSAKKEGLCYTFASGAQKRCVAVTLGCFILLACMAAFCLYGYWGLGAVAVSFIVFGYYLAMAQRQFGGLTGDLAGWFVTVYELVFVWIAGSMEYICCWL